MKLRKCKAEVTDAIDVVKKLEQSRVGLFIARKENSGTIIQNEVSEVEGYSSRSILNDMSEKIDFVYKDIKYDTLLMFLLV